ncbi:hypothetical protein L5515_017119 [Caenorhabditis briggsae]|uniref:Uncharacterized protein n=1 Tax=Caenorhabditis briggsae TaxID=6238 RepID=A0AAE9JQE8_CAEBR|nr:hypothetical protein L5515_017119 [Caenorhabditis briggsae]
MPPNQNSKPAKFLSLIQKDSMHAVTMTHPLSQLQTDEGLTDFFSFFPDYPAKFDKPISLHSHNPIRTVLGNIVSADSDNQEEPSRHWNPTPPSHVLARGQQNTGCADQQVTEFRQFFPDFHSYTLSTKKDGPLHGTLKTSTKVNCIKKSGCIEKRETREKKRGLANAHAKPGKKKFSNEELREIEQEIERMMGSPKIIDESISENRQDLFDKYHLKYYQFPPVYIREVVQDVMENHKNNNKLQKRK